MRGRGSLKVNKVSGLYSKCGRGIWGGGRLKMNRVSGLYHKCGREIGVQLCTYQCNTRGRGEGEGERYKLGILTQYMSESPPVGHY